MTAASRSRAKPHPPRSGTPPAESNSIFEIDTELDSLFEEMHDEKETLGDVSKETAALFDDHCSAFGEKVDRIGRFLKIQEAIADYSRKEGERLAARAKTA